MTRACNGNGRNCLSIRPGSHRTYIDSRLSDFPRDPAGRHPRLPCFYPHSKWATSGPRCMLGFDLMPRSITTTVDGPGLLGAAIYGTVSWNSTQSAISLAQHDRAASELRNLVCRCVITFARAHFELVSVALCSDFKHSIMPIALKPLRPIGDQISATNYLLQIRKAPLEMTG